MTNPNFTHITAVLDRSGSMAGLTSDTIGGFNKFVADQKALPGKATFTLVLFNTGYDVVFNAVDLKAVPDLTPQVYDAKGGTALYDAMAKAITSTGEALSKLPEDERPGAVIVLVMTDGEENSSKEFEGERGRQRVQAMVQHQTDVYSWNFVFLGANIDAKAVGGSLGISLDCAMNYSHDSKGTLEGYASLSSGTKGVRERSSQGVKGGKGKFFENPDAILGTGNPSSSKP